MFLSSLPSRPFLYSLTALALLAWPCSLVSAAEWQVQPGKDADEKPLAEAIAKAQPGDTLLLNAGVYHERVKLDKTLTLRGQPGTVLEGSVPFEAEWTPTGDGKAYVTPLKKRPYGLLVDGKFIAELRHDRADEKGDWHWQTLLDKGPPLGGFDQIRALWIYQPKEQKLYARFENGAAPAGLKLAILTSRDPLIEVCGATDVRIEGLELRGAAEAVTMNQGTKNCTLVRCKVASFEKVGILITGGASGCVVEECEVTRGSLEEWSPNREQGRLNYEIWRIHKDVGNYDREGIDLNQAGAGNRILRNRIHRTFDGITLGDSNAESLDIPLPDPDHGRDTEISGNLIEDTRDSGIELGVGCINVHVRGNTLRRTHGGLRFKLPRIGPVFIHHNRLLSGSPFNIWFSMDSSPAEGYVYHNTFIGGDPAIMSLSFRTSKRGFMAPKWHFLNNLAIGKEGFFSQGRNTPPPDFITSNNICNLDSRPYPDAPEKDPGSRYGVSIAHDETGKPASGSAAIDAGLDLSTYLNGKPLPGCEPGYFKGKAPDVGTDEVE